MHQSLRNRQAENEQQLRDARRYARDLFYDRNLHGVNWLEILKRYLPLARRALTDEDMSLVLREVAGELCAGLAVRRSARIPSVSSPGQKERCQGDRLVAPADAGCCL